MNRRGIIAALVGVTAGKLQGQKASIDTQSGVAAIVLNLTDEESDYGRLRNCKADPVHDTLMVCDAPQPKQYGYVLEVRYKGRSVKLTGEEIMDALEAK